MRLLLLAVVIILFASTVNAHSVEGIEDSVIEKLAFKIYLCNSLSDAPERGECYSSLCDTNYECAQSIIIAAVEENGAVSGVKVINDLTATGEFKIRSDGHELAHIVGRQTAKHVGTSGKEFLSCPSDFNYGCQHGFFEQILTNSGSKVQAAKSICENLPTSLPLKDKFYCYHGAGHGIMMAVAYNLQGALSTCDELPSKTTQEGCWQGVFMENINGEMFGESRKNIFNKENPLAPCDRIENKYQEQCYLNHAAYLVKFHEGSLTAAASSCLNASEDVISACMQSLGLMTSNPGWQRTLTKGSKGELVKTAIDLCEEFPKDYKKDCIFGAVDNFLNFERASDAIKFCSLIEESHKKNCYRRLGSNLKNLFNENNEKLEICNEIPAAFRDICTDSAGINTKHVQITQPQTEESKAVLIFRKLRSTIKSFTVNAKRLIFIFKEYDKTDNFPNISKEKRVMTEEFDSELIFSEDSFAKDAIRKFTLVSVTESLSRTGYATGLNCHNRAHEIGRLAYELIGNSAFKECGIQCHSGCRHGATEAFFSEKGTANLVENLNLLCDDELNAFNSHQCLHGIGHGLTAWSDYDLPDALWSCDLLDMQWARSSCYTGVFMENIVGGLTDEENGNFGHFTEYLNEDPQYPCNSLDAKYKNECYFLQSDRMFSLTKDFSKVTEECAKAPALYHRSCFESMGRTVSGNNNRNSEKSIEICRQIKNKENSDFCVIGSLLDQLWDESQAPNAIEFCNLLTGEDLEETCYNQIIQRSANVIAAEENRLDFCKKLPLAYQDTCFAATPSAIPDTPTEIESVSQNLGTARKLTGDDNVIIKYDGEYTPNRITIRQGQTVIWENIDENYFWPASSIHPTHEIYPEFDTGKPLEPGSKWLFAFDTKGIWKFHDHLNPRATGTVIVE